MVNKSQGMSRRTISDWEKLPDDEKCELLDGQFVMFAQPSMEHQAVLVELTTQLHSFLRGGKCKLFVEPSVRFDEEDESVFIPDIAIICDASKIHKNFCIGAPDFIIEILSPRTAGRDRIYKLNLYQAKGVLEYWIVDPLNQLVDIYDWRESKSFAPITHTRESKPNVNILDGCVIDLSLVFPLSE